MLLGKRKRSAEASRKESNKEEWPQVSDRVQEMQSWLSQSITLFLSGQSPLASLISGFHLQPDRGLIPCAITLKGKVTFFCHLMGFFNNEQNPAATKETRFLFFNGATPRLRADVGRLEIRSFIIHTPPALGQGDNG